MRNLVGRRTSTFGWLAAVVGLIGSLVGRGFLHLWSWPVRGYDNPHHGHQSTTAYGYQALPIVVFFCILGGITKRT